MNGQIQYGAARPVTALLTRNGSAPNGSRSLTIRRLWRSRALYVSGGLVLLLAAIPRQLPGPAMAALVAGAWVSLVLGFTLPSRSERSDEERRLRLARFRHAVNAIGDAPTQRELEQTLAMVVELDLAEETADDVERLRASLAALRLTEQIATGGLPIVHAGQRDAALTADAVCHFRTPVRHGRRRSDEFGQLLLTSGWLKFHGTTDLSVAWGAVFDVQRAGRDVIVTLTDRRPWRFSCESLEEAARAGVIAEHLRQRAAESQIVAASAPGESVVC